MILQDWPVSLLGRTRRKTHVVSRMSESFSNRSHLRKPRLIHEAVRPTTTFEVAMLVPRTYGDVTRLQAGAARPTKNGDLVAQLDACISNA